MSANKNDTAFELIEYFTLTSTGWDILHVRIRKRADEQKKFHGGEK